MFLLKVHKPFCYKTVFQKYDLNAACLLHRLTAFDRAKNDHTIEQRVVIKDYIFMVSYLPSFYAMLRECGSSSTECAELIAKERTQFAEDEDLDFDVNSEV